ncbi:MAG: hypothetical protein LLF28_05195 [Nitrospiraceae bacterium]|nr:hypothetical protein [Nitrospiraceae bacterium]
MKRNLGFMLAALVIILSLGTAFGESPAVQTENTACGVTIDTVSADSISIEKAYPLLASGACGGNLNCGFNTGCAPGKYYCCPSNAPNLNMCNCSCYARKNYDTSKQGGCNVWHNCR